MNERIKLLAEQARKRPMGNSWCYTNPAEFEQKFAELIVRECAKFLEDNSGYSDCNDAWHPEPEDMLKHFGVE